MIFSSMLFLWVFFPIIFVSYYLIKHKYKNIFLLFASLFFYAWGEPINILIMIFSIGINYIIGLLIEYRKKNVILFVGIFVNVGLLGYYKYAGFLIENFNWLLQRKITIPNIILPLGISFFTFQAMSYIIDVYRGECSAEKNILNMALYISFFPQLIAGPIVKYREIRNQIDFRKEVLNKIVSGVQRFSYGLAKKVIISNVLAKAVDDIVNLPLVQVTGVMAWIVAIFYTLQIYYDFSGYSDMAIGLAKMFGFEIMENFRYPYLAISIKDFWGKWHISLSSWFKEYLYIPLGGNRKGAKRTYVNLFIVFFLTGLWHGASWNFIIWGIYHGTFLVFERIGFDKFLKRSKCMAHSYTIFIVIVGWVLFRFDNLNDGIEYLKRMFFPWRYIDSIYSVFEIVNYKMWFIAVLAILGSGLIQSVRKIIPVVSAFKESKIELIYCSILVFLSFTILASNAYNPFIYFRF